MLLQPYQRTKLDEADDLQFYDYPRFVTHVDDDFIQQLTDLYRQRLQPHSCILDLMSSWVSHLPEDMTFAHVTGHGLNEAELARNSRLDRYFVQNLNQQQLLPLEDRSFDAVLNTVSIQYLQYPEAVFAEIWRVLKPGGIAIVSFSNRMFFQKAIQIWRDGSEASRVQLVRRYFASVPGFTDIEVVARSGHSLKQNGLSAPGLNWMRWFQPPNDPFFAVIARRSLAES
jgi:SAM-dependent methyltransferase